MFPEMTKVHLYCGITDMRKSINTLAILVKEVFDMEITTGHLFLLVIDILPIQVLWLS